MHINELLTLFPTRRVSAVDGMAVTAEVWEQSHQYHRQHLRLHSLLNHGDGIVTGLEVIASDPPDTSIYILPGIAVDQLGRTIVMTEPRAYDLGAAEGLLYVVLTHEESRPRYETGKIGEDAPLYVFAEYGLEATTSLPATAHVELARVRRHGLRATISAAQSAAHPRRNELDLRFRREIGVADHEVTALATLRVGTMSASQHDRGLSNLAQTLRSAQGPQVWVDRNVPLDADLSIYTLINLVGQDAFQLTTDQMTALYAYIQAGGVIFYESCRREGRNQAPPGDASFRELVASLGVQLEAVQLGHDLLSIPNLFAQPPDGFETTSGTELLAGDGIIFSSFDYGCLWQGERRDRLASRTEIRNAMEFGANIVAYARQRRRAVAR